MITVYDLKRDLIKNNLKELVINKICNNKDFNYVVDENLTQIIGIYTPNVFIEYAIRKTLLDCFLYSFPIFEYCYEDEDRSLIRYFNGWFIDLLKKNFIDLDDNFYEKKDKFKYINEFKFYCFSGYDLENTIYSSKYHLVNDIESDEVKFYDSDDEYKIKDSTKEYYLDWFGESDARFEENILEPENNMYDYGTVRYSSEGECISYKDSHLFYWIEFNRDIPFHCHIHYFRLITQEDLDKYNINNQEED